MASCMLVDTWSPARAGDLIQGVGGRQQEVQCGGCDGIGKRVEQSSDRCGENGERGKLQRGQDQG